MPKPGFNVFTSNRLEILVKQLALELRAPLSSPLDEDLIVVQSQGMARWVSMELARINRICANCFFPFPNAFLNHLCQKLLPGVSESSLFHANALAFRIMTILPGCLDKPAYGALRVYLSDDQAGVKLFQLSSKIADLFDQYLVFRPQMILGWEQGCCYKNCQVMKQVFRLCQNVFLPLAFPIFPCFISRSWRHCRNISRSIYFS